MRTSMRLLLLLRNALPPPPPPLPRDLLHGLLQPRVRAGGHGWRGSCRGWLCGAQALLLPKVLCWTKAGGFGAAKRTLCSAASRRLMHPSEIPVRRLLRRFPVDVGCSVRVDVSGSTSVDVNIGDESELITIEAEWFNPEARAENTERYLQFSSTQDSVEVHEQNADGSQLEPDVIKVSIPERWCNVAVHTWEGAVSIASVVEANLEVKTDGGNVKLGKVKGASTVIDTNGGSLEAKMIFSALQAKTHGGKVSLQQVLGNDVLIEAGGGEVHLGAMYGQSLKVLECRRFEASTLRSESVEIVAGEDGVAIGGLEGSICIRSVGGDVELQLHDNAIKVEVSAESGNVTVFLSPSLAAKVEYSGKGQFHHDLPLSILSEVASTAPASASPLEGEESDFHIVSFAAEAERIEPSAPSGREERRGEGRLCCIRVKGGAGDLTVKKRGWMEALAAKAGMALPGGKGTP